MICSSVSNVTFCPLISSPNALKELRQGPGESSDAIRARVQSARLLQCERFGPPPPGARAIRSNARMTSRMIKGFCSLDPQAEGMMEKAMSELNFSARAYDPILKVARTIADLEAAADIASHHVAEAIQYRTLDRNLWA